MTEALPLSDKQLASIRESTGRVNIWHGAVRSGKTVASLFRWLIYVASTPAQHGELAIVSRTRASAARNVFALLQRPDLFGDQIARNVKYNPGSDTAWILGRKVWVLGSSDKRSEATLRGLTCAGAYVDEVTLLQEDFFVQLLNRLWDRAQLFGTTNPGNPGHWLKRHYLDRLAELPDWRAWHFVLADNPQLSAERKTQIQRENVGLYYRRNVLGEWVAAEGAIYPTFDPARHVVAFDALPPMKRVLATGIDFGTTNPSAAELIGVGVDNRIYVLDEWWCAQSSTTGSFTTGEQSALLRGWLTEQTVPPEWCVIDPSAEAFQQQLFRDGLTTHDADNAVTSGISTVSTLLGADALRISDRCVNLIRELPAYSWDDKAALLGTDKPLKVNDHACDALRYAVASTEPMWRRYIDEPRREAA